MNWEWRESREGKMIGYSTLEKVKEGNERWGNEKREDSREIKEKETSDCVVYRLRRGRRKREVESINKNNCTFFERDDCPWTKREVLVRLDLGRDWNVLTSRRSCSEWKETSPKDSENWDEQQSRSAQVYSGLRSEIRLTRSERYTVLQGYVSEIDQLK